MLAEFLGLGRTATTIGRFLMKTNTLILILGLGGLGLGGFLLLREKPAAKSGNTQASNPVPKPTPPKADTGIFGSGVTAADIISLGGLF